MRSKNSTSSLTDQSHQDTQASTTVAPGGPVNVSSTQSSSVTSSKSTVQPSTSISASTPNSRTTQSGGSPTTTPSDSKNDKTSSPSSTVPTGSSGQIVPSGGKSDNMTTAPPTTLGPINNDSIQPTDLTTSSELPSTPTTNSTVSPHQLVTFSQSTESHPEGQHTTIAVLSSSGSVSSTDNSTLPWVPTTHKPTGTSEGTQPTTIQMPGNTTLSSTPLQRMGSSVGTELVPTTEEFTPSTSWTPVASQGPSTPSSIWIFGSYKLKCDPAIKPDEELLMLNLTSASLCKGSPPNERLMELLCHSVKASFKPAEDSCALQLAPILDNRGVAVKRIVIETKLSPKAVFELLKDKWDDLTEAGVSDMRLGKEGPPEVNEDRFSLPLIITIVCMASFLLLVAALYGCCHQRISQRKDQQRLTEELQTVENGYHDNPTLEVMETPSEMQEKKVVNLNGELGDSWIVPLDNLTKDDLDEEEDTHL